MSTIGRAMQGESMDGVGPHIAGQVENAHRPMNELPAPGAVPEQASNSELLARLQGGSSSGVDDPSGNGALDDWLPIWLSELADEPGFTELLPDVGVDEGVCDARSRQEAILEARVAGESGKVGEHPIEPTFDRRTSN